MACDQKEGCEILESFEGPHGGNREDLLEQLYWDFVASRARAPDNERILFKNKMRYFSITAIEHYIKQLSGF